MAAANNPYRPCKLTGEQVRQIRQNRNGKPARVLAEMFGVHVRTIDKIRTQETWKSVR